MFTRLYGLEGTLTVGIPTNRRKQRRGAGTIAAWQVAWILEYGNPYNKLFGNPAPIPERPALRTLWAQKSDTYLRSLRQYAVMHQRGTFPIGEGMNRLGARIAKDAMVQYQVWNDPANSPYTIAYKGKDDPLIHRGNLSRAWRAAWQPKGSRQGAVLGREMDRVLQQMSAKGRKK
jgi:hypothetical protein